jgi:hypothetical protein
MFFYCKIVFPFAGPSYSDDPKPGPSTTAAEFDLEVFDSGSSCSLEDAWGLGCSPENSISQQKVRNLALVKKISLVCFIQIHFTGSEMYQTKGLILSLGNGETFETKLKT